MSDKEERPYAPVPIGKIIPDEPLCTDVYLKIGDKFVKFKNEKDSIPGEKYNYFLAKSVKDLYILIKDIPLFMEWLKAKKAEAVNNIVEEVGEEHRKIVELKEEIKETVYETFADLEMDSGTVEILQSQVREFIKEMQTRKTPKEVMAKLARYNESIADHCVNTANFAVFISMALGFGNQSTLEHVYLGALYHDYAKAKLPASVLENANNLQYNQAIQDHPVKGAKMLSKIKDIHKQVLQIIQEHHEQHNGKGFPKGLKEDEIFGLAKIVIIANGFDNVVVENKNKPKKERFRTAIKYLEYDKGKMFDPVMVSKLSEALKLAFGDYYKPSSSTEEMPDTSGEVEDDDPDDLGIDESDFE